LNCWDLVDKADHHRKEYEGYVFKTDIINIVKEMSESNIFFNLEQLQKLGRKVIIGKTVRIRYPHLCTIEDGTIIDDFTYISTKFHVGKLSHITNNVNIAGGRDFMCSVGDFSGIGSGARVYCDAIDIENEVFTIIPHEIKCGKIKGDDIIMENYTAIGANSVVLPNVKICEGAAVGALSLVLPNSVLEPWTIYAGIPARPLKKRNKEKIINQSIELENIFRQQLEELKQ